MTEKEKQEVAAFRFSIIHEFVNGAKPPFAVSLLVSRRNCCGQSAIKNGTSQAQTEQVSVTVQYCDGSLCIGKAVTKLSLSFLRVVKIGGESRVYDKDTCLGLIRLRKELPELPVRLVRDIARKRGILPADASADLSTLYRFLNAQGLMKKIPSQAVDRRKFEAEFPNDL